MYNFPMEKREYTVTELDIKPLSSHDLLSGAYNDDILRRMKKVISVEGPLKESLLYKRVLNSYSLYKNGSLLSALLSSLSASFGNTSIDRDGEKVFHTEGAEDYFRATPDGDIRYSYQIPSLEGANAVLYILEKTVKTSYTKSELKRLFLSEMGYSKTGDRIEELFEASLRDNRIRKSGNGRILKG